MYVITVIFDVAPERVEEFRDAVLRQAENSVIIEAGCHRFDVSVDPATPGRFFLYEVYEDEAAFADHRKTDHYADFSARTADWLTGKSVGRFESALHVPAPI